MIIIRGVCPANTPRTSPYRVRRTVPFGKYKKVKIISYPGADNLLHVRILRGNMQIIPEEPGQWIPLAGEPIEVEEELIIDKEPNTIFVEAYNEDAVNDHEFLVLIMRGGEG